MKFVWKCVRVCLMIAGLIWLGTLAADRVFLNDQVIRLHVVANSDSSEDQSIKMQVRDAVNDFLQETLADVTSAEEARAYIAENLPKIQTIANEVLVRCGVEPDAVATFCKENFGTRLYDTFRLPAGVYEALRITIGEGEGKNWWCVAFPTLCIPATSEGFEDVAAGAGFPDRLNEALMDRESYSIRFFLLDCMGRVEKFFHRG